MPSLSFLTDNCPLPKPAEPERALRELDMWHQVADARAAAEPELADFMSNMAAHGDGQRFLAAIFGNSPFLSHADPAVLWNLHHRGLDRTLEEQLAEPSRTRMWRRSKAEVMSELRIAKRSVALTIAIADIAGAWPLDKICEGLSRFADISISIALSFLLYQAEKSGQLTLNISEKPE